MAIGNNPQTAPNARAIDEGVRDAARYGTPTWGQRLLGRVVAYAMQGVDSPMAYFGPQQPLLPVAQAPDTGAIGRPFDYPTGFNTRVTPRIEETISFATLKALAESYDVLRIIIETRKDQIASLKWQIGPKDRKQKRDARCDALQALWETPDHVHTWADWVRILMEQLFVLDAPAIWCRNTRGGDLYGLEILDGATFTRKLTIDGRTPLPDEGPAYQQVLKGLPAVDYIVPVERGLPVPTDQNGLPMPELIYKPRNPRVDHVYGYSPVEQIIMTVNIALRREFFLANYYTEGSTPDLLLNVPETWNPDQIRRFQEWWDSVLLGNLQTRRGARFIPAGVKPYDTKEKALTDETDQWLVRICCFAFSISPSPFIKQMNRATAENAQEVSIAEGLQPIQRWITDLVEYVHAVKFGITDLTMVWEETEVVSPEAQATIDVQLVNAKIFHPDEVRAARGFEAMPDDMRADMDVATFNAAANSTVLPDDQQAARDAHAVALAAAKPAPVVGPPAQTKQEKEEFAAFVKSLQTAPPSIHVAAPAINIAPAAVHVTTPPVHVKAGDTHVTMPEIRQPDMFVDVGATNVKIEQPRKPAGARSISYERDKDGTLVAKITETTSRVVRGRTDEGKLVAKIER